MRWPVSVKWTSALAALALVLADLPAWASSLVAWRITPGGQLELRTSLDVRPQAFFEAGSPAVCGGVVP